MGKKEQKPAIRFQGFTDAWEQRKFSDFVQRESIFRESSSEYPSVEYEDVNAEEGQLNKDIRQKVTQKTGIVFDGSQVLYGKLRPYLHNWLSPDFTGVAVGDWWVLRPVGVDKKFLYRLIQTRQFDEVANQSSGSKMPRADWNLVSNTEFIIPSLVGEQRQIAENFDALDNLITLHQRKYEKIVNVKKSMLEKMFPRDGASVPEIRFAGFTDPWEQRKLSSIVDRVTRKNTNLKSMLPLTISAQYGLVDQVTYFNNRVASQNISNYYLVKNGEFAYNKSSSEGYPLGVVKRLDLYDMGVLSTLYIVFTLKDQNLNSDFLACYYDTDNWYKQVSERAAEGARNHGLLNISAEDFLDTDLMIPPDIQEQVLIGDYLKNLDHLITLHQRKLEMLKNIKKAMLEKMFV